MDMAACLTTSSSCCGFSSVPTKGQLWKLGNHVVSGNSIRTSMTGPIFRQNASRREKFLLPVERRNLIQNALGESNPEGGYDSSPPPALDEVINFLDGTYNGDPNDEFGKAVSQQLGQTKETEYRFGLEEGYVGLFVRLLGLDNSVEDREEAVQALWRHSAGGKEYIDQILEYPGCLNLIVSLLPSDRPASSEAAAGLLRNISSINAYKTAVVEAGALEEVIGLLTRRSKPSEVREQATCVLWNLSVEEGPRAKLVEPELLSVLLGMLGSDESGESEAAAGVLANLSLSPAYHKVLVEGGVIPKLAKLLVDEGATKVAKQEAKNALLELAKEDYVKLLIIEEGLVFVPVIGANAYRSFKPLLQEAPTLPESIAAQQASPKPPSTFGAGELLLGLNLENGGKEIDEAERLIIEGRVRQQFLARIGVLEKISPKVAKSDEGQATLMPWWDGITRLVLILGLDNFEVAKQALEAIAQISINEEYRQAVQKAGAVPHLVRWLGCGDEDITEAAVFALEKLAISRQVRGSINAHDAPSALVAILNAPNAPQIVKEKVVGALYRLSQTGEEEQVEDVIHGRTISGLKDILSSETATEEAKEEAEEILEEMTSLAEPRDKIVAAGGVPALIDIMVRGTPTYAEKAASVLENLATEKSNAAAIVAAGVESALLSLLDVTFQEGKVTRRDGTTMLVEEGYMLVGAASRLLGKVGKYQKLKLAPKFASLLTNILRSDVPLRVKDWVSACLLKLERMSNGFGDEFQIGVPVDFEVTVHDTIPWLVTEIGNDFSPTVRERAVMHLRQLMSQGSSAYSAAIINAGGVYPLVDLLRKGTAEARAAALAVLYNLSMNEENHSVILAAGATPALVDLIRRGGLGWNLALYLLRALPT
ncbi:hypothetical protein R1sor_014605 [Riccia sorocarpa]|uniref:Uncharacterized protein n=1 Tax=Riccia sorocarpa TaxID=122646 RepID=A0ABD3HBP7_9MARC